MVQQHYPAHRGLDPIHPGELIEELFEINGLKIMPTAEKLGISRQQLHRVLRCDAPVTPHLAVKLGKLLGNGPNLWINLQSAYDIWRAEQDYADEIAAIEPLSPPPASKHATETGQAEA